MPETDDINDPDEGAKTALDTERRARRAAEKQLKDREREFEQMKTRLQELDDRDRSETDKAAARAAAAEARAAKSERDLARYRIAAEKKLDLELASRLQGDTDEELAADADALVKRFGVANDDSKRPAPDFDAGARKTAPANNGDPGAAFNDAIRSALRPT